MEPSPESAETRRRRGRRRAQAAPRQGSGAESRRVQIRQLCRQLRRRRPRLILNDRLHCCNSCRWKIFRESNFEASLALQTLQRRRTALFAWSFHHPPCGLPRSSPSSSSSFSPYSSSSSSSSSFLLLLRRRRPRRGDSRHQIVPMVLNDRLHISMYCRWKIFANPILIFNFEALQSNANSAKETHCSIRFVPSSFTLSSPSSSSSHSSVSSSSPSSFSFSSSVACFAFV